MFRAQTLKHDCNDVRISVKRDLCFLRPMHTTAYCHCCSACRDHPQTQTSQSDPGWRRPVRTALFPLSVTNVSTHSEFINSAFLRLELETQTVQTEGFSHILPKQFFSLSLKVELFKPKLCLVNPTLRMLMMLWHQDQMNRFQWSRHGRAHVSVSESERKLQQQEICPPCFAAQHQCSDYKFTSCQRAES